MQVSRPVAAAIAACALAACFSATADGARGKIKICRLPALPGSSLESVYLPADGTYVGPCDASGDCRKVVIGVTAASTLKASADACTTLDAMIVEDDGQPVEAGQTLIPKWNTGKLVSRTKVVESFH